MTYDHWKITEPDPGFERPEKDDMADTAAPIAAMAGAQPVKWGNTFESADGMVRIRIDADRDCRHIQIFADRPMGDADWAEVIAFIKTASVAPAPHP